MLHPVTVCFAFQQDTGGSFDRAAITIASVRKYMPDVRIVQLSNLDFPQVDGTDEIIRHKNAGDFIEWGFTALIKLLDRYSHVLQIATDVVLTADVRDVFYSDFDVAACPYPLRTRTDGTFCGDVNFIKASGRDFWSDVLGYYLSKPKIRDGWEGGQTAFRDVALRGHYKILSLDHDTYCFTPDAADADYSGAKIVHFRGRRKAFMPPVTSQKLGIVPLSIKR